jgi:asparagine synthase (glutamine-hydrolysing)
MSGIVGLINVDGAPVNRQLLQKMTEFMAYRGPDAQVTWIDGHVGFGHAMLRTTQESLRERQPLSLNGQVWVTADARVDSRTDLFEKLLSKGCNVLTSATDAELILHAYHTWAEDCLSHLLGDFVFAIWDGPRQRLFCARDHFGVKLFYYAQVANYLVFSNTLECIRAHPAVSDKLDDLAIGDFLLFGFNQQLNTTTFSDIQRLPPAHCLTWSQGTPQTNRYWTLPTDGHIRYKHSSDYVEHFRKLLRTAVNDRLRTDRVGVFMSGGLDSPAVAATAYGLLSREFMSFDLRAYTGVYDVLIPDEERHYSGLVADTLGIPIHYLVADNYMPYETHGQIELRRPEPVDEPLLSIFVDQLRQITAHSRVALTGWDGDAILSESPPSYFGALFRGRRFGRLFADMWRYVWSRGQLPPIGCRTTLKRLLGKGPEQRLLYPVWLNEAFARRHDLPARWEKINAKSSSGHPLRPDAHRALTAPAWSSLFESYDPGVTRFPLEARHPLVDVRLVDYLLAIPPVPWCVKKELLRVAMRNLLPEPVCCRPKTPLAGYPVLELFRQRNAPRIKNAVLTPQLAQYIDRTRTRQVAQESDPDRLWMNLRPLGLDLWLRHLTAIN